MKRGYRRWYRAVLKEGCGSYSVETMDGIEYECRFDRECDNCPVLLDQYKHHMDQVEETMVELIWDFNYKENE